MLLYNGVILTKDDCDYLLSIDNNFRKSSLRDNLHGVIRDDVYNDNKRKSTQLSGQILKGDRIYKKIEEIVNNTDFKLTGDYLWYDVIKYKKDDFIFKHQDRDENRFMICAVQLSDTDDYSGGDFKYWIGDTENVLNRNKGYGILFKPDMYHEVTKIEDGERHSFIIFIPLESLTKKKPSLF
jgi:hypothetical protein